ncbi:MAG: glycine/sarcosine/betaine reductase selenoprotein B family protein [Aerococcus sp.]|nr:glycine/sarcosine/betaine reductase selenoprotein B family protein [Aerococcus sp.]
MSTFKRIEQKVIGKVAEHMVLQIDEAPAIAKVQNPLEQSRVALVTTAGIRNAADEPFDTKKGDPTFRVIDRDVDFKTLVVNHDHYDTTAAKKDINIVFPLEVLRHLEKEGVIGSVAPRHFGWMGYIPRTAKLMKKTAPMMADMLVEDQVDIVLLSPG